MGLLGRAGCFLKSTAVGLDLSRVDTVVFDKTGTLTVAGSGDARSHPMAEAAVIRDDLDEQQWRLVRRLAAESVHPISRAIAGRDPAAGDVRDVQERAGEGISGWVDGHQVAIGRAQFVGAPRDGFGSQAAAAVFASVDGTIGAIHLTSVERPGIEDAVRSLGRTGDLWLLSGDQDADAERWRPHFGDRMRFRQSPEDKLRFVRQLQAAGRRVLMIGDGLNDAGALAAADVGVAVSDDTACLVPACDAVIGGEGLRRVPALLRYARIARQVIVLCFAVSVAYNVIGLWLALAGRLTPLATAILMPVSSLTVVGLSVGLMRRAGRTMLANDPPRASVPGGRGRRNERS
jgi:Cu+-exporting ATPase